MATLISSDLKRFLIGEGYSGSVDDMWKEALQTEIPSSLDAVQDLEKAFLEAQGHSGSLLDMWYAYLGDKGYTGSLPDRWKAAIAADDVFVGATLLVYDDFSGEATTKDVTLHAPNIDNTGVGWTKLGGSSINVTNAGFLDVISSRSAAGFEVDAPRICEVDQRSSRASIQDRYVDFSNSFYALVLQSTGLMRITEFTAGTPSVRAETTDPSITSDVWLADDGETISVGYGRGTASITYSSTAKNTSTWIGPGTDNSTADGEFNQAIIMTGTTDPSDLYTP